MHVKKALKRLVFDGVEVKVTSLPQARNSRPRDGRPECHGNSNCIPICPIQAKYDATVHVQKSLKLGARLAERAAVTELKPDASGLIGEVVYKTWDGQVYSARAKAVVLAAHAIESAKILHRGKSSTGRLSDGGRRPDRQYALAPARRRRV